MSDIMATAYEPLPQGGTHTRLLRLCPETQPTFTAKGELAIPSSLDIVNLDDENVEFIAISYTWLEGPMAARITLPGGASLVVNQNVLSLIEAIRRRQVTSGHGTLSLWIDALCINQHDVVERASQVSMMGRIYSSANLVLAWLGPSSSISRAAFSFVKSVATRYLSSEEGIDVWENFPVADLDCGLCDLLDLLSARWFQRTWVIQEVTLGRNVALMCGDDTIDLDTFRDCVYHIWVRVPLWDLYDTEKDPAVRGLYSVTKLLKVRHEFHRRGAVRLEILLEMAYFLGVTDRRDSVHGFRAICSNEIQKALPTPDYTAPVNYQNPTYQKSLAIVFKETSAALLRKGTTLNLLALAGTSNPRPSAFPSWAIYITQDGDHSEPFVASDAARWHAGGATYRKPDILPPDQLKLSVKILDQVDHECKTFTAVDDLKQQKETITQILNLWDKTKSFSRDHHLEQLAYDLVLGLDCNDLRVGPEIVDQFKEYLQWLRKADNRTLDDTVGLTGPKAYHQLIETRIGGWMVFITRRGYLGIGPKVTRRGDMVAIVPGCRLPLILRPVDCEDRAEKSQDWNVASEYNLISWCYMRGLMRIKGDIPDEEIPQTMVIVT